jgi:hypothetical protein
LEQCARHRTDKSTPEKLRKSAPCGSVEAG